MDANAVHGLEYPSGFLESLQTLDDVVLHEQNDPTKPTTLDSSSSLNANIDHDKVKKTDASNIYLLSPAEFAKLHESHLMNPASEDVLFPFLHGLEGGNQALSGFFLGGGVGTSSSVRRKVTVPRYRGLMWVICEDDLDNPERDLKCLVHPQDHELGIYGLTPPDYDEDSDGYFSSEDDLDDLDDEETSSESASNEDINNMNNSAAMDVDVAINDSNSPVHGAEELDDTTYMHPVSHRPAHMTKPMVNTRDLPVDLESEIPTSSSFASTASDVDMGMAVDVESASVSVTESPGIKSRRERKRSQSQFPQVAPPILTCSFRSHELLKRVPRTAPVSGKVEKSGSGVDFERGGPVETGTGDDDAAVQVKVEMNEETVQVLVSASQEDVQLEEWSAQDPDWEYQLTPLTVPEGISLRNFGCQVAILASMSDIVVYSPCTDGSKSDNARKLARRFREALERKRRERISRGHPPNLLPIYNVFLLDAGAEEIRKEPLLAPLCVKVKESGACVGRLRHTTENMDDDYFGNSKEDPRPQSLSPGNTVDFAQREREEMRELTRASEIVRVRIPSNQRREDTQIQPESPLEGKIWLGNVNDVPMPVDTYTSHPSGGMELDGLANSEIEIREWERLAAHDSSTLNPPSNPLGFDICIECHETAALPGKDKVRAIEERIDLLEAAWRAHTSNGRKRGPRPPPTALNILHFPFPSSPPANANSARDVQGIAKWLGALIGIGEDWENLGKEVKEDSSPSASASSQTQTHTPASSSWSSFLPLPHFSWTTGKEAPRTSSTTPPPHSRTRSFTSPASTVSYSAQQPNQRKGKSWSRPLNILVYSSDGYTESSVFALCLLMGLGQYRARGASVPKSTTEAEEVERGMSLPEAYLQLQLGDQRSVPGQMHGRSFFVYHGDLSLLRKVDGEFERERREKREMKELRERQEREREKMRQNAGAEGGDKRRGSLSKAATVGKTGTLSMFGTNVNPYAAGGWTGRPSAKSVSFNMPGSPPPVLNMPSPSVDVPSPPTSSPPTPPTPTPPPQEGTSTSSLPSITSSQATVAPFPFINRVRSPVSRPRSSTMFSYGHGGGAGMIPPYLGGGDATRENKLRRKFFNEAWFNDGRFDGSFPSRVLDGVYLGNLNHASNVYMLQALGITHVVSVGECALVPPAVSSHTFYNHGSHHAPPHMQNPHLNNNVHSTPPTPGSLFLEEKAGRIKVLDIQGVCDDGIDTLSHYTLDGICAWMQKARDEGGEVLVHCRVGVSRSATVVIAYVMKSLGIPLVDAYLIVRSRRLSVLIQPNMRLLYGLCGWEIKLAIDRAKAAMQEDKEDPKQKEKEVLKRELSTVLTWPYLAKEVHRLNEKYLG